MQMFTKRQKAKGPATLTKRGAILGEDELPTVQTPRKLINLEKPPDVLSSWIGKNPRNIVQLESSKKLTGFNEIAWRDRDGSKLYLENLDSNGAINEGLKVTYPEVQSLGKMSGWKNPLPDTIVVKSAGGSVVRMAAKKMVLGLLDSYQSDLKLPNKPILKETKTDNPGGEFAIEFSVKGITQIEPIMGRETYMQNYSHVLSDDLMAALMTYQNKLKAGVVNGFRVEEVALTQGGAARKMFLDIKDAAEALQSALEAEIAENKKSTKVTAGPGLDTLKKSLATLETLQTQVESAIKDGFRNEFDTRRWQQWLTLNPKPLTEDVIVPGTGTQIGAGVQGPVFKYELDPALARRPVILKYDRNGLNDDAAAAGIPGENPQQSVRAVATFKISEHLNLGVIPRTEVFVGTDDNGRPKLGQAMEFVNGAIGQRTAGKKNVPGDQKLLQTYEDILKNPGNTHPLELAAAESMLPKYVKVNGTWYSAQIFPPIVDISTALSILNANFNKDIRPLLAGLSDEEIAKAAERFDEVKRQVGQRVMAGKIASMGDVGDQAKLQQLGNKVQGMGPMPVILRWGNPGIAGDHTDQNSYLGLQLAQKNWFAQQYPETGGVLPQSGPVGLV